MPTWLASIGERGAGPAATLLVLALTFALAFALNAVTLPLPPTWLVLAAIYQATHVPPLLLALAGTAGAALGRGCFALVIRHVDTKLPPQLRENAAALARAVHGKERWATPFVALYTFLPLPTNPLFVAVGTGALPLPQSLLGYFAGRLVHNTLMILAAGPVVGNIRDLLTGALSWRSLAEAAGAAVAYLIFLSLPWKRWLRLEEGLTPED